ncbi:dihydroorotate oxidase [Candidatus Woesearchaeota archaeon CG10_big_fil_rev_8_21_14_0_10_45_16]|nr:MAG: dihydroorotate oxidase [Candidatus Woesearchaeota archaeon CG10_big_fil_rev_8_21_14_0_10_45_16]
MLLKNGKVHSVEKGGFIAADLRIKDGLIAEIKPNLLPEQYETVVDCAGKHVIPGLIDAHVHFREPGATHKEDFLSGSKAAAAGGVTTILDMPNNNPPTVFEEQLKEKRELAMKSIVNYGFYLLGCVENKDNLRQKNIAGIKVYLGSSTGNYLTDDLGVFAEILQNSRRPVVVHAENEQLIRHFNHLHGNSQLHHKMRDALCAVTSLAEAITISSYLDRPLHIAHCSTKAEMEFLQKNKTTKVTCEVCPHHLFLTEAFFIQKKNLGKMNPPLRYVEDQEALWTGIRDGVVDMIATDHAPHTKEEKNREFQQAPCGVPGVQTMLPLLLNAVHENKLTLLDVIRLTSTNPARIFYIENRGELKEGYHADICVIDLEREGIISDEAQFSKCGWTPFHGMTIKGWPVMTIVNGQVAFERGRIYEEAKGQEVHFAQNLDLSTMIGGVPFQHPIFNAAGPRCTTEEELELLGASVSSAIMTKSCTLEPRDGNPEPRYHDFSQNSINSNGLCNLGYQRYAETIPGLKQHGKPCIVSVSGLSLADNLVMLKELSAVEEIDLIELNLSCPNVIGKPQVGYDFEQSKEVLKQVSEVCTKPFGVKLPPYFDFAHFQEMADILNQSSVSFVTCVNSLGNGLVIDPETEEAVIKPKGGFGGVGGTSIKPFGLSNVRKFRELLRPEIQVIGVGGITSGKDVFEYILAGADAVQLGTVFMQEDTPAFERIVKELQEIMKQKGYASLEEFKNKLKVK